MEGRRFRIETLDWNGNFGIDNVTRGMKQLGTTVAQCHVYDLANSGPLKQRMDRTPLNEEPFSAFELARGHLVDVKDGDLSLRLDLQNVIDAPIRGLVGKFARYEIQINGVRGGRTSIANVCIPLGIVMTGDVVVDAFNESIRLQRMAVILNI